jgi:succinoglycan biosynthesis protein ExoM
MNFPMNGPPAHISVCLCTFKRPDLLKRLLDKLEGQITNGLFTYSISIADNDALKSAQAVAAVQAAASSIEIVYGVEPRQNIALARNLALKNATGGYIALIDDDEIPGKNWLRDLFEACRSFHVDGVLGPVRPYFEHVPPAWVIKGKFFDRPTHATGYRLSAAETRSGNVLFKREIIEGLENPFRPEFGTGSEDNDFFRRMIGQGRVFVWCREAAVDELVPPARCRRGYQIKKALLRGGNALQYKTERRLLSIMKSVVAIPVYGLALPLLFIAGDHLFMKYLVSFCDHSGKILKLLHINPVRERAL